MATLARALAITADAFKDKYDKGGKPYFMHCVRVMLDVDPQGDDEDLSSAALFHDLVEDCEEWTFDRLLEEGYSLRVVQIVQHLTHHRDESYDDYIHRVATHQDAKRIKRADLRDNSQITRMKGLREKDFRRLEKYHRAYAFLED